MAEKLQIHGTAIPGLLDIRLDVREDERGSFTEIYQATKLRELGLPPFRPVQNNRSVNLEAGVTRGLHAEPWEKYVATMGRVLGVWVELRPVPEFGTVVTMELTPDRAVFVPRGVANGYQTLEPNTIYSYLVNRHWREGVPYVGVNLFDPELAIEWPIPPAQAIVSDKDMVNPMLADIQPMKVSR